MANKSHIKWRNLRQLLDAGEDISTADFNTLAGTTASSAELNLTDALSTAGNATASKLVLLDANKAVLGIRRNVTVDADGLSGIGEAYSRGVFTNEGAQAAAVFALGPSVVGVELTFVVMTAQELRIDPSGTETIALPSSGAQGAAGKYLTADAVGEWVRLLCVKAGQWQVIGYAGTWAHEAG
jgi:hypothetical protein